MARRRKLSVLTGILLALGVASAVLAYFTAVGNGDGNATVTSLGSPSPVTATSPAVGSVHVTWSSVPAPSGSQAEVSYTVERSDDGGSTFGASAGTCSGTLPGEATSCDDSLSVAGTYAYRVTASFRTWTSAAFGNDVTVVVDVTPPTSTITFPANGSFHDATTYIAGCTPGTAEVCGTAADPGAGASGVGEVEVSIQRSSDSLYWNGSTWVASLTWNNAIGTTSWSYPFAVANLTNGLSYAVSSRAIDVATNIQTTPDTMSFTFDTAPPAVSSIVRAGSDPTSAPSVSWTVTFSESVSGVDATDFALAATGLGGTPAITGVTPAGPEASYSVTASTGTGSGSLGLNLVDNDSIVDGAGKPLGGSGTGNGNFIGQVYALDRTAPTVSSIDGPSAATIAFESQATNISSPTGGAASTTLTINKPLGVSAGNLLLAQITFEKGSDAGTDAQITPSGWTLERRTNRATDIGQAILWKVATATDASGATTSYTWTFGQAVKSAGGISHYTGVDTAAPIVASSGGDGDANPLTAPGINAEAGSRLVAMFGVKKNTTLSTPGGMTLRYTRVNPSDVTIIAADEVHASAGATGNRTSTAGSVDKWIAQAVALRAGNAPVNTASVSWTVTFSESVSGVDASDFALVSGGLGGTPAISSVTPAGPSAIYTVTASTGSGSGTLGLNLVDDDSIIDAAGNSLGGPASGNFTGEVYTIEQTGPTGVDVQATNDSGLVVGQYEAGDRIAFTFSETMKASSVFAGWDGSATTVRVEVARQANTNPVILTIRNTADTADVNLGSVSLARSDFFSQSGSRSGQFTSSTMVRSGNTITITLGTYSGDTRMAAAAAGTMVWSPTNAATDLAGNAMSTATVNETGTADKEF